MTKPLYLFGEGAPLTRLSSTFPTTIDESLVLGLDIGIGSCGQALVSIDRPTCAALGKLQAFFSEEPSHIRFMGVRAFDTPEEKTQTGVALKNPDRRAARLIRRGVRRRAQRMRKVRLLLKNEGLLPKEYHLGLETWRRMHEAATPWQWRVEGLSRRLEEWEWAVVLIHFAKHRGFKSNKKSDYASKGKEAGTLQSTRANHEALGKYRSVSDMMLKDARFSERIRNRSGLYTSTVLRADLRAELVLLFEKQRELGNPVALPKFEEAFLALFEAQNEMQHPYVLLAECPFEKEEKRGPRMALSFELSRALQKLNSLTLRLPDGRKVSLSEWVGAAKGAYEPLIREFGKKSKVTWGDLRKYLGIGKEIEFEDLPLISKKGKNGALESLEAMRKEGEQQDFAVRGKSGCSEGSWKLRQKMGDALWEELRACDVESLDNAVFCLTFFESPEAIIDVMRGENLSRHLRSRTGHVPKSLPSYRVDERLVRVIEEDFQSESPKLANFEGAVALSTKASRKLITALSEGLVYSEACAVNGYQHTDTSYELKNIVNPVVASVLREVMKQVVHLIDQAGVLPGSICVELARDLGKSIKERNEMTLGIGRRTRERNENRADVAKLISTAVESVDNEMLLRYELWQEQSGYCPYCGETLPDPRLAVSGNLVQIDHVLPRSRSHDNSLNNKVLVHIACNQNKGNRTPAEWLGAGENREAWQQFQATVRQMPRMKGFKKRSYLLNETFHLPEEREKFISRNLNDTRYIVKMVLAYLKDIYRVAGEEPDAKGAPRRIFAQPGALTSLVRRAWGLENLKKDLDGRRIDDMHHSVDALICACLSEGQRQWITRSQQHERARLEKRSNPFRNVFNDIEKAFEEMEERHVGRLTPLNLAPPWRQFRNDVVSVLEQMKVSRRESRKGRGQLHQETFYQVVHDEDGNPVYYSRRSLLQTDKGKTVPLLKNAEDLDRVKGIDDPKNEWLKTALSAWVAQGSPTEEACLPRNPAGVLIQKLTMRERSMSGRPSPHGYVVSGKLVRLDVFSEVKLSKRKGAKPEKAYHLVPVYAYHLQEDEPPRRAIVAHKPESQWTEMDERFKFEFSLWPNSLFEVKKKPSAKMPEGESILGYYRGVDRDGGSMSYRETNDASVKNSCSVKVGCLIFRKLSIDRLGRISQVKGEKRTWRGKECT